MPEIIQCPECRRQLRLPDELPDNLVRCPSCAHEFVVNRTQDGGVAIVTTPSKSSPKPVPVLTPAESEDESDESEGRRRRENDPDRRRRADDIDDRRRRRRRTWSEDREPRRFVAPRTRNWGMIIAILTIVVLVGGAGIVTVVAIATANRRKVVQQAPPFRVANNLGDMKEPMPANDAELTQKMKDLFGNLSQAYTVHDLDRCVALFDVERIATESLPLLNLPARNVRDQNQFEQALRQGLRSDLDKRSTVLLWTSTDVRKVTRVNQNDVVVIARHQHVGGVWIKLRWSVSRRSGRWLFHDVENLVTGIHYPLLVASEAARNNRVDQQSMAIRTLGEVENDLGSKQADAALKKLDGIKAVNLPPSFEPARHALTCLALLERGKPEEALKAINQALALQPDLPGADYLKGVSYLYLGKWKKALPLVEGYHRLFGDETMICRFTGLALWGNQRTAEAVAMYRKALELNPKNADAFLDLLGCSGGDGHGDDLVQRFLLLDNQRDNYDKSAADCEERHYSALLDQLARAMQKADPKFASPDYHLSVLRAREGKSDEAVALFKSAQAKQQPLELRKTSIAKFLEAMASSGKITEAYAAAPDAREAFRTLAEWAGKSYQPDALIRLLAMHRKTNPNDPLLPLYQAEVYVRLEQYELAEKSFAAAQLRLLAVHRKTNPDDPLLPLYQAEMYVRLEQYELDEKSFAAALLKPPDEATLTAHRGSRVLARYYTGKALSAYREIGPKDETFRQLAELALENENDAVLQSLLDAHAAKNGPMIDRLPYECRLRIRQNRIDEAVALFKTVAANPAPDDKQRMTLMQIVSHFAAAGHALEAYRAAPDAREAFLQLARYLLNDGRREELPRLIEAHRAAHAADPWLSYYQGELHVRDEAWDKAAVAFGVAWKNAPKDSQPTFRGRYALALYRTGQWAQAYEKLEPRSATFAQLASLMLQDKKGAELEVLCKAHQAHAGDDPEILYYQSLAAVLAGKPGEAIVLLRKATEKNKEQYRRQGYQRGFVLQMHEQGLTMEGYQLAPDRNAAFSTLASRFVAEKKENELESLVAFHTAGRDVTAESNYYLGELSLLRGQVAKAEGYFRLAVEKAEPTNLWRYRYRLNATRVKGGKAVATYQEMEHTSANFEQLAGLCVAEKDAEQLQALIEAHRNTNPDDSNLPVHELEVLWLKNDYAGVVKVLTEAPALALGTPANRWKTRDYLVRSLIKLKRFDEAIREADTPSKRWTGNAVLLVLAHAATGKVEQTLAVLNRSRPQPWLVADCYRDPDLGPILRSDAFKSVREKYPEPKNIPADGLEDDEW